MTDLRISDAFFSTGHSADTGFRTREEAQMAVMRHHGVSREQYEKTIRWYGSNLDKYEDINEAVSANLRKRIARISPDAAGVLSDENNIWPYGPALLMTPWTADDAITFSLADAQIEKGGYVEWRMKTSSPSTSMTILLGADYTDGSSSYLGRNASGFAEIKVRLQSDTARTVKRIFGYLRPSNILISSLTIDSISLVRMPYDSTQYYKISNQTDIDYVRPERRRQSIQQADSVTEIGDSPDNSSATPPGAPVNAAPVRSDISPARLLGKPTDNAARNKMQKD